MDHILNVLANMLAGETKDENLIEWIRDHQETLVSEFKSAAKRAHEPTELNLASCDDLVEELKGRTTAMVVAAEFDQHHSHRIMVHRGGSLISAMGLLVYASNELSAAQADLAAATDEPYVTGSTQEDDDESGDR